MINIDIYDNCSEKDIRNILSGFFRYIRESDISYIEITENNGYIYVNKEASENEWDYKTIQMCELLNLLGFDAFLSDEDYGYIDVIVIFEVIK